MPADSVPAIADVPDAAVRAVLAVMGWRDNALTGQVIDGRPVSYWELATDIAGAALAEATAAAEREWAAACDVRCDRKDWSYTWGFDDRADAAEYVDADPINRRLVRRRPELIEEVGDAG